MLGFNIVECIQYSADQSQLTIANAIKGVTSNEGQRHAIYVTFSCTYSLAEIPSLNNVMRPTAHEVHIYSGNIYQGFNLTLTLWKDACYRKEYITDDKMMTKDYIYVTIDVEMKETKKHKVQV